MVNKKFDRAFSSDSTFVRKRPNWKKTWVEWEESGLTDVVTDLIDGQSLGPYQKAKIKMATPTQGTPKQDMLMQAMQATPMQATHSQALHIQAKPT